jgi:hypothetical protein
VGGRGGRAVQMSGISQARFARCARLLVCAHYISFASPAFRPALPPCSCRWMTAPGTCWGSPRGQRAATASSCTWMERWWGRSAPECSTQVRSNRRCVRLMLCGWQPAKPMLRWRSLAVLAASPLSPALPTLTPVQHCPDHCCLLLPPWPADLEGFPKAATGGGPMNLTGNITLCARSDLEPTVRQPGGQLPRAATSPAQRCHYT